MRDLVDFTATDIVAHSTPRYFDLIDDLVVTANAARTSNTGTIDAANDLIIGEDDDAIAAKNFYRILTGFTVYNVGGQEYYTIGSEQTADVYTNVNDPNDTIAEIPSGADSYYRTGILLLDAVADKVYVKCTKSTSVTTTTIYRYVNVADSTDFLDPEDPLVDDLKELTVKGNIVVDDADTLYVQFIPEIDYRKDAGYNVTPILELSAQLHHEALQPVDKQPDVEGIQPLPPRSLLLGPSGNQDGIRRELLQLVPRHRGILRQGLLVRSSRSASPTRASIITTRFMTP
ncbi:MAG: hypothetical protein MZU97_10120 [Bacillus subtilis]|nr:hypothetical protein [Bacillus subtilis]